MLSPVPLLIIVVVALIFGSFYFWARRQGLLATEPAAEYYSCCFSVCDRAAAQRGWRLRRCGYLLSPPSGRGGSRGGGREAGAVVVPAGAGLVTAAPC